MCTVSKKTIIRANNASKSRSASALSGRVTTRESIVISYRSTTTGKVHRTTMSSTQIKASFAKSIK